MTACALPLPQPFFFLFFLPFFFSFFFTLQHHFRNYISFQELLWDVSADGGARAERFSPATMLSEGGNVTSVPPAKLTLWKWTLKCSRADLLL